MSLSRIFVLLCALTVGWCKNNNGFDKKIVIVGAGASGIAAATKLYENGFHNIVILEGESRLGGRINSFKYDKYLPGELTVELGAEYVHGNVGNPVHELAYPLGVLEKQTFNSTSVIKIFHSRGGLFAQDVVDNSIDAFGEIVSAKRETATNDQTYGDFIRKGFREYFNKTPTITKEQQDELLDLHEKLHTITNSATTWDDLTLKGILEYQGFDGYNWYWKNGGYALLLDILLKRYPNATSELPILSKTIFDSTVTKIDYSGNSDKIKVTTENGKTYEADYVIVTVSLGVLKNEKDLFNPPLPEKKINAIQTIGYGNIAKIFFVFDEPWSNSFEQYAFAWSKSDKQDKQAGGFKNWLFDVVGFLSNLNFPNVIAFWVGGEGSRSIEQLGDKSVKHQLLSFVDRFMGNQTIPRPIDMIRSRWFRNKHFYGTFSYTSVNSSIAGATRDDLAEPIIGKHGTPIILFAGEATSPHYATVPGAVLSGWREAERIINMTQSSS